jgi:bifunctional non-homologous end joining protein LigD
MARADPLATYNAKRDFTKTAEPKGTLAESGSYIFMVQKHDATRLHYDFRIELDGVMKSWAVTRGPSLDPADKRLAVRTEDHPLGYASFEGTIPKGEYGGGTVMLWDWGNWIPYPGKDPRKTLQEGHLHFTLKGERMKGEWLLIRLKPRGKERTENWLLRKIDDEYAGSPTGLSEKYLTSIKTGRAMQQIATGKKANELASFHKAVKASGEQGNAAARPARKPGGKSARMPAFREPQKATLADKVPSGSGWIHEMNMTATAAWWRSGWKGQGIHPVRARLVRKVPEIAEAAPSLPESALLDGEIVSLTKRAIPASRRSRRRSRRRPGPHLFLFDARDRRRMAASRLQIERKQRLAACSRREDRPSSLRDHIIGQGEKLFEAMCEAARRASSPSAPTRPIAAAAPRTGSRSNASRPGIRRHRLDAERQQGPRLPLAAARGQRGGELRYAGKVGTGFRASARIDSAEGCEARATRPAAECRAPRRAARIG